MQFPFLTFAIFRAGKGGVLLDPASRAQSQKPETLKVAKDNENIEMFTKKVSDFLGFGRLTSTKCDTVAQLHQQVAVCILFLMVRFTKCDTVEHHSGMLQFYDEKVSMLESRGGVR